MGAPSIRDARRSVEPENGSQIGHIPVKRLSNRGGTLPVPAGCSGRRKGSDQLTIRRWAVAALAAATLTLAGAGVVAASGSGGSAGASGTFLGDVASHLGVQPAALQTAIEQADVDRINGLLAAGKLTAAQAQARIRQVQAGHPIWVGNRVPPAPLFAGRALLRVTSGYLGLTRGQIAADLRAGQSLNQIAAGVSGHTAAGLQAALAAAVQARLAASVAAGHLTAAREQAILQTLPARLTRLMAHQRSVTPAPASTTAGA